MASRPLLPQDDPNPAARRLALEQARMAWVYGPGLPPLAIAAAVPAPDRPTVEWAALVGLVTADTGINDVKNRIGWLLREPVDEAVPEGVAPAPDIHDVDAAQAAHEHLAARARAVLARAEGNESVAADAAPAVPAAGDAELVAEAEQRLLAVFAGASQDSSDGLESISFGGPRGRPRAESDYFELFAAFPAPAPAVEFTQAGLTDELFVRMRVAGPNPEMLTAVDAVPDGFPGTLTLGGEPVATLAAAGRLFLADYSLLATLVPGTTPGGVQKYVCRPRALFAVSGGKLVPVAIQCEPGAAVFRPGDGAWNLAKHVVQVADMNWHEMVTHLGRTHLLVEPFLMATHRHLAPTHPINRLLLPHFEGTVFINHLARTSLVADGGVVDHTFAGTIASSRALAVQSIATFDFGRGGLPTRIAARRTETIAEYPWRDDALRIWQAIADFVRGYVRLYYPDAATLAADVELRSWGAVLARPFAAGGIPGFTVPNTPEALADALTLVIYTASAQHAAVNFPQLPDMSYAPIMSGAGWRAAPAPGEQVPDEDLAYLPPLELALSLVNVLHILGGVHYTRLGAYGLGYFGNPAVDDDLVPGFQRALAAVEAAIEKANQTRHFVYTHLLPRLIPQSINI
jgi:arachidonate 15-lipoxygenase